MFKNELDRLLIENLDDLDFSAKRLLALSDQVARAFRNVVSQWADDNGWLHHGDYDAADPSLSIAPPQWLAEDGDWLAAFSLESAYGDKGEGSTSSESPYFWLTRVVDQDGRRIGFRYYEYEFPNTRSRVSKFIQESRAAVGGTDFVADETPSFFLPFGIDRTALAGAVEEGRIEPCLEPLRQALDHIRDQLDRFLALREELTRRLA